MNETFEIRINGDMYGLRESIEEVILVLQAAMVIFKYDTTTDIQITRRCYGEEKV